MTLVALIAVIQLVVIRVVGVLVLWGRRLGGGERCRGGIGKGRLRGSNASVASALRGGGSQWSSNPQASSTVATTSTAASPVSSPRAPRRSEGHRRPLRQAHDLRLLGSATTPSGTQFRKKHMKQIPGTSVVALRKKINSNSACRLLKSILPNTPQTQHLQSNGKFPTQPPQLLHLLLRKA